MRIRSIAPALGLAALGLSIAAVPAASADYPVLRGSQIEDVPPPPSDYFSGGFNWTGFYVGGLVGGTQTRFETDRGLFELARFAYNATTIGNQFNPDALVISRPTRDSGPSYGGYIGYNLAFGDAMIGIEADYSRLDQRVAASTFEARRIGGDYVAIATNQDIKLEDYASLRARFGYAFGRFMPYLTVGAAAGRFTTNIALAADWGQVGPTGGRVGSYIGWPRSFGGPKNDVWGFGAVAGGGIEAALAENIVLRAEYLYTRFDNVEGVTASLNTARVGAAVKF